MFKIFEQIGLYCQLMGKVFARPEKPAIYGRRIMYEMEALGFNSIGLTAIISIFIGAVITLQMAINLESPFIPKYLIGYATRETMILEFSSTVVALILSGKVLNNPTVVSSKKTLLALANPNMVDRLMDLALLVRKENSHIPLSAITVVLDEDKQRQQQGTKVLDQAANIAASVNVPLLTKMRLTTNLAHGIVHEVKENDYRELILGFHKKETANDSFLGNVLPEVLNSIDCQVVMARMNIPLNTVRTIHITFPAKAEFEAGFPYWVEETARMSSGLGCKIMYHGHPDTMEKIKSELKKYAPVAATFYETDGGNDLKRLSKIVHNDHLLIIVSARRGSISFRPSLDHIFVQLQRDYQDTPIMLIYPSGYKVEGGETH